MMQRNLWLGALILCGSVMFAAAAGAASLNAPFDLPHARKATGKQSSCDEAPPAVTVLATGSVYKPGDPTHSTIDPDAKKRYDEQMAPLRDFSRQVAKSATRYLRSNGSDRGAAICAVTWLTSWAKGGALDSLMTRQAALSSTRILASVAFSWIEVSGAASDEDRVTIDAWLGKLAKSTTEVYAGNDRNSDLGNHRYWGGLAVGAIAIAIGDRSLLDWALDSYRIGICQVRENGALPIELSRGPRSRDYHMHAVAPLVMLAEMGERNGVHAYDECGGAIHRLVKFILTSLQDPSEIEKLAGATQLPLVQLKSRLAWVAVYRSRFELPVGVELPEGLKASTLGGDVQSLYGD